MPEPAFTPAQAQALLDETIRPLAERMVALRREMVPLERRWRRIVLAIGSNGGGLDKREAEELREALERAHGEVTGLIEEITSHGVQIKDPDRGLLDFPTVIDGEPALLCWLVGEQRIEFWHTLDGGFAGRRPLP